MNQTSPSTPSDHDDVPDPVDADSASTAQAASPDEHPQEPREKEAEDKSVDAQPFRTTLVHALRAGAFLGALCLGAAAVFFMSPLPATLPRSQESLPEIGGWFRGVSFEKDELGWWIITPLALMFFTWMWVRGTVGWLARLIGDVLLMVTVAVTLTSAWILAWNWWRVYQAYGLHADQPLYIAAALMAVLCITVTHCLLNDASERESEDESGPLLARMRRAIRRAVVGEGKISQRDWRLAVTALVVVALMVPGLALAPSMPFRWPVSQQLAAPVEADALPAMPTTVGTAAAWSREFPTPAIDIAPGARGPIVLTKDGLEALNPEDGTTLWSYHRDHAVYLKASAADRHNWSAPYSANPYLVTSPDRRHIAFRIYAPGDWSLTTILDAVTGHVTAERLCEQRCSLQLTDSAALVGDTAISLADGSVLWSIPPEEGEVYSTDKKPKKYDTYFSGAAGHSTFIRKASYDDYVADLELVPDTDPTRVTTLDNVNPCLRQFDDSRGCSFRLAPMDGWVGITTDDSPVDQYRQGNRTIDAVSLDEVAARGTLEGVRRISMGQSVGINYTASVLSGQLVTAPPAEEYDREHGPWVGSILDTTTGIVQSVDQSTSLAGSEGGLQVTRNEFDEAEAAIVLKPGNGSPGASIPVPWTSVGPLFSGEDVHSLHYQYVESSRSQFLATPGVVIVAMATNPHGGRYYPDSTRVYGVR